MTLHMFVTYIILSNIEMATNTLIQKMTHLYKWQQTHCRLIIINIFHHVAPQVTYRHKRILRRGIRHGKLSQCHLWKRMPRERKTLSKNHFQRQRHLDAIPQMLFSKFVELGGPVFGKKLPEASQATASKTSLFRETNLYSLG